MCREKITGDTGQKCHRTLSDFGGWGGWLESDFKQEGFCT